jgi:hypothetical protein
MMTQLTRVATLYRDGFRSMVLGRQLWAIILVKLLLIYALAKLFFPNYLQTSFSTDQARAAYVMTVLTGANATPGTKQQQ